MRSPLVCTGLMLLVFTNLGPHLVPLFLALFMVQFFNNAMITLIVGPICAGTVPPYLMATAAGMVIAVGELFGGGLGTVIAGQAAEHFTQQIGIGRVLYIPVAALVVGFVICLRLKETLPSMTGAGRSIRLPRWRPGDSAPGLKDPAPSLFPAENQPRRLQSR